MGADIRAFIEYGPSLLDRELKASPKCGHFFAQVDFGRDYRLFAALSGTRGDNIDIEPVALPRGLPKQVSPAVQYEASIFDEDGVTWVQDGGYDHSWLTRTEVATAFKRAKIKGPHARAVLAAMAALPNALLVFWYD